MADDQRIEKRVQLNIVVERWYRATAECPITGKQLTAYGEDAITAKRRIDLQVLAEAQARGIEIVRNSETYTVVPITEKGNQS